MTIASIVALLAIDPVNAAVTPLIASPLETRNHPAVKAYRKSTDGPRHQR